MRANIFPKINMQNNAPNKEKKEAVRIIFSYRCQKDEILLKDLLNHFPRAVLKNFIFILCKNLKKPLIIIISRIFKTKETNILT